MKRPHPAVETLTVRWAGILLAAGLGALMVSIVLYAFVLGTPEGTGPDGEVTNADFARLITENRVLTRSIWFTEMSFALLVAVGAFGLKERAAANAWPTGSFWSAVGIGSMVNVASYGITLGAYWHAAAVIDTQPALFDAVRGAAGMTFGIGTLVVISGLSMALLAEARSPSRVLPGPVAYAGAAAGVAGLGYPLAFITGVDALALADPLGLVLFPIAAYLGVRVWWPRPGAAARHVEAAAEAA